MDQARQRIIDRKKRSLRIRKRITGSGDRPRLCVRRSHKHIYAQVIDDTNGVSLAQVGSISKTVAEKAAALEKKSKTAVAGIVGSVIAEQAKEKGVNAVVFDRKGYPYHGRVKALADSVRKGGLDL